MNSGEPTDARTFGEFLKTKVPKYRIADIMQYAAERFDVEAYLPKTILYSSGCYLPKTYLVTMPGEREIPMTYTVYHDEEIDKWSCDCDLYCFKIQPPYPRSLCKCCKHAKAVAINDGYLLKHHIVYPSDSSRAKVEMASLQPNHFRGAEEMNKWRQQMMKKSNELGEKLYYDDHGCVIGGLPIIYKSNRFTYGTGFSDCYNYPQDMMTDLNLNEEHRAWSEWRPPKEIDRLSFLRYKDYKNKYCIKPINTE